MVDDVNETARQNAVKRNLEEEEAARRKLARKLEGPDINDLSQRFVNTATNIATGGIFTQIDNMIPWSWPDHEHVEKSISSFVSEHFKEAFYHAADKVAGRNQPDAAPPDNTGNTNDALPRKPGGKFLA